MKKLLTSRVAVSFGFIIARFAFPALASAQVWTDTSAFFTLGCRIVDFLFAVLIFATIFFVVLAAYKYLTSGGEPDKVKEASQDLLFAAVAIVVALLAKGVPAIVGSLLGVAVISTIFAGCP
ncbi:MAG: hypothetical protein Q7S36_00060 [Candidatus Liptonbacteria bacterium]|nr:hypothetical protein [Candidatus Liptonbacteria bacterium]